MGLISLKLAGWQIFFCTSCQPWLVKQIITPPVSLHLTLLHIPPQEHRDKKQELIHMIDDAPSDFITFKL